MTARDQVFFDAFDAENASDLRRAAREALENAAYDCVLHPLGFYLIRLAARGETTVRLHYWPSEQRESGTAITPYHDHVWALTSCILVGAIENVFLELHDDTNGDFEVANITQTANVDEVIPAATRVRLSVKSTATYRAGEFYEIPPREFHFTNVPPATAAVTLVRAVVVVEGGPRTLLPVGASGHAPSRSPAASSDSVVAEIIRLLAAGS
jgi:hypothetical protein